VKATITALDIGLPVTSQGRIVLCSWAPCVRGRKATANACHASCTSDPACMHVFELSGADNERY